MQNENLRPNNIWRTVMEVVYLFYESGVIRIPFLDYDQRLFRMLVSVGGGTWDNTRKRMRWDAPGRYAKCPMKISSRILYERLLDLGAKNL